MRTMLSGSGQAIGLVLVVGMALLVGCSDRAGDPTNSLPPPGEFDLEATNGGLTATPESPGFGDAALRSSVDEETPIEDGIEEQPDVREMVRVPGAQLYLMTVLWGNLSAAQAPDQPAADGTAHDWSGRLSVERGVVALRSVISFEREEGDSILRRPQRTELAWKSSTGEGFDGLRLFLVHVPRPAGDPAEKDSVRFKAGTYARTFAWSELDQLDEEVRVDGEGNRISFLAYRTEVTTAQLGGFLRGRWDAIAEGDSVGRFQGVWVSQHGRAFGFFRGGYGTRADSSRVFFGKYIDADGDFLGILRGTWGVAARNPDADLRTVEAGWFRGEWVGADDVRQGTLQGRWRTPDSGRGLLRGRWCRGICLDRP